MALRAACEVASWAIFSLRVAGRRLALGGRARGREARKSGSKIPDQIIERQVQGGTTRDDDAVPICQQRRNSDQPQGVRKTPPDPIPLVGRADLLGDGEAEPNSGHGGIRTPLAFQYKGFARPTNATPQTQKIAPLAHCRKARSVVAVGERRHGGSPEQSHRDNGIAGARPPFKPQADKRLRPLARRRASTLRPPTVDIRCRNP